MKLQSINPGTETLITEVKPVHLQDVNAAITHARTAFQSWNALSIKVRATYLKKVRKEYVSQKANLVRLLGLEQGKPKKEAELEFDHALKVMDFYLKQTESFLKPKKTKHANKLISITEYLSLGVVAVITPWSSSLLYPFSALIPALLAGNTVILKPSSQVPVMSSTLEKIFVKHLPRNVLNALLGDASIGEAVVKARPDKIIFIGGTRAGKEVYLLAAEYFIPCTLLLSGNNAMLIDDSANIAQAADAAIFGAFCNAGQSCTATRRIYITDKITDAFLQAVVKKTKHLKIKTLGPVKNQAQLNLLTNRIREASEQGARILIGGKALKRKGFFFEPTIVLNPGKFTRLMRDETFGPIMNITVVSSFDEAIEEANDSPFGLQTVIFTGKPKLAVKKALALQSGTVSINAVHCIQPESPWRGNKESGFGVLLGEQGLHAFTQEKTVFVNEGSTLKRML